MKDFLARVGIIVIILVIFDICKNLAGFELTVTVFISMFGATVIYDDLKSKIK